MTKVLQFPLTHNILVNQYVREIDLQILILEKKHARNKHIFYGFMGGTLLSGLFHIVLHIIFKFL